MSDWANERNMGNPSAVAGHFADVKENKKAPPIELIAASPTLTRTGPSSWVVEIHTEDLERWTPDVVLPATSGRQDDADLDHVLATLLPVANLIRTLCGQSRLDAAALLEVLAGSAPHRR